ncbi:MAG: HEPN domain-containing protein [Nanoarchaeota archaeon]
MANNVKRLIEQGFIARDSSVKNLATKYLQKARNNIITMSILSNVNENKKARELLKIPSEYNSDEWVVICGYYAMYSSALALIAKLGFRSKNHIATITILEESFILKKILAKEDVTSLKNAILQKEEIEKLSEARHKREIAQYSVTKQTTKEIVESIKKDAYQFINKVESII